MAASTPMKDTNTNKLTFTSITREESELLSEGWRHCVHIMLYSALPDDTNLFNNIGNPIKHTVMVCLHSLKILFQQFHSIFDNVFVIFVFLYSTVQSRVTVVKIVQA